MDPISAVWAALIVGAVYVVKIIADSAIKDAYASLKSWTKKKISGEAHTGAAVDISATLAVPAPLPQVILQIDPRSLAGGDTRRTPHELPPAAAKHFGRGEELRTLTERLRAGKDCAVVGPAGMGKTALAAEAVRAVVGDTPILFPDGVVFLDLYTFRGQAELAWSKLANTLAGPEFMANKPAVDRATAACCARSILVIIEGGEEADGQDGRTNMTELCSVLSHQNRRLLMTRLNTQAASTESVVLKDTLNPDDAGELLDSLTDGKVTGTVRKQVLDLLEGHPLALTWAGNLLARGDDAPERLVADWKADGLRKLSDPAQAEHTLEWLFNRSVRGLDDTTRQLLSAAGLLARAPFPLAAMVAALGDSHSTEAAVRGVLKSLIQRGLLRRLEEDHWEFTHVLGYRFARKETGSDPILRERLAHWLSGHLQVALHKGTGDKSAHALSRTLGHGAALLRADDDHRLRGPLARDFLYEVCDRLMDMGRLDLVKVALGAVAEWLARLPEPEAQQLGWLRERSVLRNRQGDVLRDQGDLAGALAAYRESLSIMRPLAEADPSNAVWQRDLFVSLARMAGCHAQQGKRTEALPLAEGGLAIAERLAVLDRSNVLWQRDVAAIRAFVARLRGEVGRQT